MIIKLLFVFTKVLIKNKNLLQTTNSEKAIYFLSLRSCSINKLKSYMLVTCKNFVFSDFT